MDPTTNNSMFYDFVSEAANKGTTTFNRRIDETKATEIANSVIGSFLKSVNYDYKKGELILQKIAGDANDAVEHAMPLTSTSKNENTRLVALRLLSILKDHDNPIEAIKVPVEGGEIETVKVPKEGQ